jgi:hypothetical protein
MRRILSGRHEGNGWMEAKMRVEASSVQVRGEEQKDRMWPLSRGEVGWNAIVKK